MAHHAGVAQIAAAEVRGAVADISADRHQCHDSRLMNLKRVSASCSPS